MEAQDIRYLFRNYNRYKQIIENLKDKLQTLRTQAEKITPNYGSEGGSGGKNSNSKVENYAIKIQECEDNIKKIQMFVDTADDYLRQLKTHQRKLIKDVLINDNSYEYIANIEDTTPENIRKMVNSALNYLAK